MINIPRPNKTIIEEYLTKWDNLEEHYIWQESSLDKLFHQDYKYNTNLNEILIKCSCLNDFYSTNIFLIYPVAKNIYDMKIDERLKNGDSSLVNDIANVKINNKNKFFYSFASKYCSHHNAIEFPIYDYFVDRMLWYFQKNDKFSNFKKDDLKDYTIFKRVLNDFKKFYDIDNYNLRDIDKYLWIAGKEFFLKNINMEVIKMNENMNSINVGNAGEYFVAGELERRGFTVGVPMSNVKDYDLLCISNDGIQYALQVKTTSYGSNKWMLSKKNEKDMGDNVFYVFVHLHELGNPSYYIVPSKYVAETIYKTHREWLEKPARNGEPHKDSNLRIIAFEDDAFLNKWDYLK